ncbi:MAG TPA: hypothetical protein VGP72_22015 [Planctomycetota bacterium]|jgi:hypothetical protein
MSTDQRPHDDAQRKREQSAREELRTAGVLPVSVSAGETSAVRSAGVSPAAPGTAGLASTGTPRIWVLPTASGEWWPIAETNPEAWAQVRPDMQPQILSPKVEGDASLAIAQQGRGCVMRCMTDKVADSLFAFVSRGMLSGMLMLIALFGLRMPGWLKEFDTLLLLGSTAFLIYSIVRYGAAAMRWHNHRIDVGNALARAKWVQSPLAERLVKALTLRHTLPPAERGKSPDDELLDVGAYRNLIRDGVTTEAELCALGKQIAEALDIGKPNDERPIAEIARKAGLDTETAIFYRDLAAAAAVIALDSEMSRAISA